MRFPRLAPFLAVVSLLALGVFSVPSTARAQVVRFGTSLGNVDVQLLPEIAPATVTNFLGYVDRGDYNGSFLHRSVPGFVVQGGGYRFVNNNVETITQQAPVVNEFNRSNQRGTIAMAKLGGDPNSATNQWFFNLADNSGNLDSQNGGFTVFGQILDDASQRVVDAIAALEVINAGSPFDQLPVINFTSGSNVTSDNLVQLSAITRLTALPRSTFAVVGAPQRGGFVVSRTDGIDVPVTVSYHNGGSASRGVDYEQFPGTLSFAAGQTEAVIPVRLLPGANRNKKVKVFLDFDGGGTYDISKFQSKVFLSDLP